METAKTDYTREELISICEQSIVSASEWSDRDSDSAMQNVGKLWAYLKAGCPFRISTDGGLITDDKTIWVYCQVEDFSASEYGTEKEEWPWEHGYLPTQERLDKSKGKDWY